MTAAYRPSGTMDSPPKDLTCPLEVSVVIVSYNCLEPLRDCLHSIQTGAGSLTFEVIVVDNNSMDGTVDWVHVNYPEHLLIANAVNHGFARACNQGIKASSGRYVLLLNPDTIINDSAIQRTHEYMQYNQRLAASGCKVLRPDGRLDPSCKRDFPSLWDAFSRMIGLSKLFPRSRTFSKYDACDVDENKQQEVPLIDGCYMMIRRSALDDIGMFDERFFMYAEEMDWCKRAQLGGWRIGYDPSGTIVHIKGEVTRHSTFRMLYHFHRSMALYYRKHNPRWHPSSLVVYPGIATRFALLTLWNLGKKNRRVSG